MSFAPFAGAIAFPQIDPVALSIGPLSVHWYGLAYVAGFLFAWWYARRLVSDASLWPRHKADNLPIHPIDIDDFLVWAVIGIILGGRLGYVLFYDLPAYLENPLRVFMLWQGGMSFHGGMLGVILAMMWWARSRGRPWLQVTDFIAPCVPVGLASGRIGNLINGELCGGPSNTAWAIQVRCAGHEVLCFDKLHLTPGTELTPPLHPSQLYQAALEGLLLFMLVWLFSARPRPRMAVSGLFLVCYGVFRLGVEFVRMPDVQIGYLAFGWVTMGQLLSAPMIIAGVVLLLLAYRDRKPA